MGPDFVSFSFADDCARTGPILWGDGQEKKRFKHVDAMFYVLGHCQCVMGRLCV
jgi:hypothetical protein